MIMNKLFRFLSIVMIFVVVFNFYGCLKSSNISTETNDGDVVNGNVYAPIEDIKFNLAYLSNDTFNPFTVSSDINASIVSLLYDSLFAVDNTFKPIPQIAESSRMNGTNIVVTIKSGLTFSDGSFVTVSDVAYSFDKAKESDRFNNVLSCFESAEVSGTHDITFTMNYPVQDAAALLTFPVIKIESVETTDETEDTANSNQYVTNESEFSTDLPIGSGRYCLKQDSNKVIYLSCNSQRLGGFYPLYRNIGLISTVDTEQIKSMYSLGRTNVTFDTYQSGEYTQILGLSSKITLPNFVYLVCNNNNSIFHDPVVKKAISYAIDRDEICDYSFVGNAYPTELPFHSSYYKTQDIKPADKSYNDAVSLLENNGYTGINDVYDFRYNTEDTSKVLSFRLAVCNNNSFKVSAAEKIKEQLAKANIRVDINKYSEDDFFDVLSSGNYDLYLGECKMKNNLDLTSFFTTGNNLSIGIDSNGSSAIAYTSYKNGETDIKAFVDSFCEDYPFIPVLYRSGNAFSNSSMGVGNTTIPTDYYNNIDKWKTVND